MDSETNENGKPQSLSGEVFARFENFFGCESDVYLIFDDRFNFIRANRNFYKLTGTDKGSSEDPLNIFFPRNNHYKPEDLFGNGVRNFRVKFNIHGITYKSEVKTDKVSDIDGKVYCLLMCRNIKAENSNYYPVSVKSGFYRSFYDSDDAILLLSKGEICDCNSSSENLFSIDKGLITGKNLLDFSSERQDFDDNPAELFRIYLNTAENGVPVTFEWKLVTGGKDLFDAEITFIPVISDGKKYIEAVIKDNSAMKISPGLQNVLMQISNAAHDAENLFILYATIHKIISGLMNAENFYIALYNEETDLLSFPYFTDEKDRHPEPRKPAKGFTEYVMKKEKPVLLYPAIISKLQEEGEIELYGTLAIDWLGVPLKIKGKTIGVVAVQSYNNTTRYKKNDRNILSFVSSQIANVIYRKQYEEKLRESEQELIELNRSKDRLFSIIAHDLKSPFTALLGFSEMMYEEAETLSQEEVKLFSGNINKVAKNVHELLENLLHWSRFQTGNFSYNAEKIDLGNVVKEVFNLYSNIALSKNINLINEITDNSEEIFVYGDNGMLNLSLRNLIGNGIKFTNEHGSVTVKALREKDSVRISVIDTGVGMKQANISKLFKVDVPFTTQGTGKEKGTGLGLILCREMIEKNNGKLSIISEPGKGSNFSFTIPVYKGE